MMNKQELTLRIRELATEVVVELRHRAQVPEQHFGPLMETLRAYRDLIDGEQLIEREVTSYLQYLHFAFLSARKHLQCLDQERYQRVQGYYNEFVVVMNEILDPWAQADAEAWRRQRE